MECDYQIGCVTVQRLSDVTLEIISMVKSLATLPLEHPETVISGMQLKCRCDQTKNYEF